MSHEGYLMVGCFFCAWVTRGVEHALSVERAIKNRLHSKERKSFGVIEKFRQAATLDIYSTICRFLCTVSHNNLNPLRARHFGEDNIRYGVSLAPPHSPYLWVFARRDPVRSP